MWLRDINKYLVDELLKGQAQVMFRTGLGKM